MENKQGGTAGENSRPCGGVFVLYIIQRIRSIPEKDASFCSPDVTAQCCSLYGLTGVQF